MTGIRRVSDLGTQGVKTILDGSIQSADIANGAVTSAKLDTNISVSGTLTATNLQALTTTSSGHGIRIRGGSGDTAGILQFTNNAGTTQWGFISVPSDQVTNFGATTLQRNGNAFVNIVDIPIEVNEWNMGGSSGSRTLSTNIPTTARYIYADVFTTNNSSDHFNIEFSNTDCSATIKNWVDTRGQQPSTQFGNMTTRRSVYLTHSGEVDGYTPNYGVWFSGILIPISGRTLYWGSFGSNGQAWIYLKVLGYSN